MSFYRADHRASIYTHTQHKNWKLGWRHSHQWRWVGKKCRRTNGGLNPGTNAYCIYRRFCKDTSPQSPFQMYLALVIPHIPHDVFVHVPWTTTLRSSSKLLYHQPFAHTNEFLHSFVPKTCSAWNNFPDYITHANTLSVLKSSLGNFMSHVNSQLVVYILLDMLLLACMWLLHYPVHCLCISQQVH